MATQGGCLFHIWRKPFKILFRTGSTMILNFDLEHLGPKPYKVYTHNPKQI